MTLKILFAAWWLITLADGFIAAGCARGFWREHVRARRGGREDAVSFWTAVMLACFAAESLMAVVAVPLTSAPFSDTAEALWVAVIRRTVKATGMWLWWLKAFNGKNGNGAVKPQTP